MVPTGAAHMKITSVRSRPVFTWETVKPRTPGDRALREAAKLRDCARRGIELAWRCVDEDIAELLFDVAHELQGDADSIESEATEFGAPEDG